MNTRIPRPPRQLITFSQTLLKFLLVAVCFFSPFRGGSTELSSTDPETHRSESVAISLEFRNRAELDEISSLVSIENVRGNLVLAVATPEQLMRLRAAGYNWKQLPKEKLAAITMCPVGWEDNLGREWNCYPSYQQYTDLMQRFASDHSEICRLVDLGTGANTVRPHSLWAVVISDNPDIEEDEPEVLLTSSMHGDETTGFILMLRLIDELLTGHGNNSELTSLVNETEIWINPLANPDGTYFGSDSAVTNAIRSYTTSNGLDSGVDPNRNFPDPRRGNHPDGRDWWPETEIMMELAEAQSFVLSANFHGGIEVVNYPWDTWSRRHPDDSWFRSLSRAYADLAQSDSPGGYLTDRNNGITNGYDWYQVAGGRQDFMIYWHGDREVTIEISTIKILPAERLEGHWSWNRRALLNFLAESGKGIRGVVTSWDGEPLAATIEVLGHDTTADSSVVRTDPDVGDYHRLLLPGTYDLRIEAAGYLAHEVFGVAVTEGDAAVVDVVLYPTLIRHPSGRLSPPVESKEMNPVFSEKTGF